MLYALPDHEVMQKLLPGIAERWLEPDTARERLQANPGLVPIAIDPGQSNQDHESNPQSNHKSIWFADIGDQPFLEWKHIYTVKRLADEGRIGESFVTDFSLLDQPLPVTDGMQPDGLLLHVSRCGSTLFCKSLARLESNLIINQAGPLQYGFWAAITDHWHQPLQASEANLLRLRRLVHLLTRRRGLDYQRAFVKFISWNTIYADFIRAAFPASHILFLYRDPAEVIATVMQETTAALTHRGTPLSERISGLPVAQTRRMDNIEYLAHCYANYYRLVAERAEGLDLRLVNYRHMRQPECFAQVLARGLDWHPDSASLEKMREQYNYYSKDDSNQTRYQGEPDPADTLGPDGKATIDAIAAAATGILDISPRNLFEQRPG